MAANISNSPPRFDYARTERDDSYSDEPAAPDAQTSPLSAQPETTIVAPTEQESQSGDDNSRGDSGGRDNSRGTHDPANTPAPPPSAEAEAPTFMRYGIGDTVITGRPDYANSSRAGLTGIGSALEPVEQQVPFSRLDFNGASSSSINRLPNDPMLPPRIPVPSAPAPTPPAASASPIPMQKPGAASGGSTEPSAPSATNKPLLALSNAPIIGGESVTLRTPDADTTLDPNSLRQPYLTSSLHTPPDQSPHYANALAYGREHGWHDGEVMKLAVLMQNNGDANMGREWLSLPPEVLRAAVNAVVRNADNSFDTSGVFGGALGLQDMTFGTQRVYVNAEGHTYTHDHEGNTLIAALPYAPPAGWVLAEETLSSGGDGDNTITTSHYYRPSDELVAERDFNYLPLAMTGHMQVPHGRDSELSVGADGGVIDLSRLKFDPLYGLITPIDNYIPIKPTKDEVGDGLAVVLTVAVTAMLTAGIGAAVGIPAITAATSVGGAIAIGAASGAIGGLVSGAINGNLSFKGVFQSALSGGLFAGLAQLGPIKDLNGLGLDPKDPSIVTSYALRALSITGQATLRGALQELIGGKFKDGFTQGIVQGLASEIGRAINSDIAARLQRGDITAEEAVSLRQLSGYTTAAIRALGNPGDPLHAFAQEFIGQLVGDVTGGTTVPEVRGTVFDDDGNVMPGIVDAKAPLEDQSRQIYDALVSRGMKPDEAADLAGDYYDRTWLANVQNARPTLTDPVAIQQRMDEIDEALRQQIRAEELNEASLGGGELLEVGGGSGNGARPPAQISTNRGVENALNLAADPFGVLGTLQELPAVFATLDQKNIEERINNYRQRLIDLGVPNVPTGYAESIGGPDGRISRDYVGTVDALERSYGNFVEDNRLRATWGDNYRDVRIGTSNMTVQEFERTMVQRTQSLVDRAYEEGRLRIAEGKLPLQMNSINVTLGNYIDKYVRDDNREFLRAEGITDGRGSQYAGLNRNIVGIDGTTGRPDMRLGGGFLIDWTLERKTPYNDQIRNWIGTGPVINTLIIRPSQLPGGSYVIPTLAVPKPKPRGA